MEDITDVDYRHAKRIFNDVAPKNLSNKNLGDYHDLKNKLEEEYVMQYLGMQKQIIST